MCKLWKECTYCKQSLTVLFHSPVLVFTLKNMYVDHACIIISFITNNCLVFTDFFALLILSNSASSMLVIC